MIISRTPFRVSFFGGGTDYPGWYRLHGGAVLATTVDKYCYLTCRFLPPFFEHRIRVVYSKIENCQNVDDITHPAVREILRYCRIDRGVEIHHDGDLPARSGMGTSSAFTVGLLHALYALKGHMPSKRQLATESIGIEQDILKETVGSQDQVLAAYGGFKHVIFSANGEITVRPVTVAAERMSELNQHLMLFYSGIKRTASDIAGSYVNGIDGKEEQLRVIADLTKEGISILCGKADMAGFGSLLDAAWQAKRHLSSKISNWEVEEIYREALSAGALGGKLLGAGGGGFMLLFVPPSRQSIVKRRLKKLIYVPFKFESSGSQIIFFDPEQDYSREEKARVFDPAFVFRELSEQDY
ncbi:MAG: kinase [Deltaproteobacteria bacterium]|nr:kinase [Deltaproteobacteria bacterium]